MHAAFYAQIQLQGTVLTQAMTRCETFAGCRLAYMCDIYVRTYAAILLESNAVRTRTVYKLTVRKSDHALPRTYRLRALPVVMHILRQARNTFFRFLHRCYADYNIHCGSIWKI